MKKQTSNLLWISACLLLFFAISIWMQRRPDNSPMNREIIERSERYIQDLGGKPVDQLSSEQKLILIHAYYNIKDYSAATFMAESMTAEFKELPAERRAVFVSMVADAYRQQNKKKRAKQFEQSMQ